jgi:hypothetical protein
MYKVGIISFTQWKMMSGILFYSSDYELYHRLSGTRKFYKCLSFTLYLTRGLMTRTKANFTIP